MTVIAQDNHLTAGAWAACGGTSKNVLSRHSLLKSDTIIIQTIIDYLVFQQLPQVIVVG